MLYLPERYESIQDEDEKTALRRKIQKSAVHWVYEADTEEANPLLHRMYRLPQAKTRQALVGFATNTWDGDIVPFRESLSRVVKNWDEVSAQGTPCPISSTDDELVAHLREGQHWNERARFWDSIGHFVSRDGQTSHEDSEDALRFFATLREEGLESLEGEELAVFERGSRCTVLRGVE